MSYIRDNTWTLVTWFLLGIVLSMMLTIVSGCTTPRKLFLIQAYAEIGEEAQACFPDSEIDYTVTRQDLKDLKDSKFNQELATKCLNLLQVRTCLAYRNGCCIAWNTYIDDMKACQDVFVRNE